MHSSNRSGAIAAKVKQPNVAGTFYPGDGEALRREVDAHLGQARPRSRCSPGVWPRRR